MVAPGLTPVPAELVFLVLPVVISIVIPNEHCHQYEHPHVDSWFSSCLFVACWILISSPRRSVTLKFNPKASFLPSPSLQACHGPSPHSVCG